MSGLTHDKADPIGVLGCIVGHLLRTGAARHGIGVTPAYSEQEPDEPGVWFRFISTEGSDCVLDLFEAHDFLVDLEDNEVTSEGRFFQLVEEDFQLCNQVDTGIH